MRDYSKEEVLFAIVGGDRDESNSHIGSSIGGDLSPSFGSIVLIAKRLGCSWTTADTYIKKYELEDELKAQRIQKFRYAESTVVRIMLEGEDKDSLSAAKLVLSTTGVSLGHTEYANTSKVELSGKVESSGNPQLKDLDIESIINLGKGLDKLNQDKE